MVLLNVGNALPNSKAKAKPKANATGDDTQWATQENGSRSRVNTSSINPKTRDTPISATMTM